VRFGLALLRAVIGGLLFGHGTQKLAGWFGGSGLKGTAESFESMELSPGVANASAAGAAEAGGGALIALGLATPVGAAAISASMLTAIRKVHGPKGPWVSEGGYEYNLVLLACMFALTEQGPGALSLDALRGRERWGMRWALAQLAAGAAGSAIAIELAARRERDGAGAEGDGRVPADAEEPSNVRPIQPAAAGGPE
jgi:putative oxidoreductase